jgi:hypothetical protein
MATTWTEQEFEELKRLLDEGCTAREIGEALGMTRNAIISKANRTGLVFKHSKKGANKVKYRVDASIFKRAPKPEKPKPPKMANLEIWELEHWNCRYPVGTTEGKGLLYCGAPRHRESYCAFHYDVCYEGVRRKEKKDKLAFRRSALMGRTY